MRSHDSECVVIILLFHTQSPLACPPSIHINFIYSLITRICPIHPAKHKSRKLLAKMVRPLINNKRQVTRRKKKKKKEFCRRPHRERWLQQQKQILLLLLLMMMMLLLLCGCWFSQSVTNLWPSFPTHVSVPSLKSKNFPANMSLPISVIGPQKIPYINFCVIFVW